MSSTAATPKRRFSRRVRWERSCTAASRSVRPQLSRCRRSRLPQARREQALPLPHLEVVAGVERPAPLADQQRPELPAERDEIGEGVRVGAQAEAPAGEQILEERRIGGAAQLREHLGQRRGEGAREPELLGPFREELLLDLEAGARAGADEIGRGRHQGARELPLQVGADLREPLAVRASQPSLPFRTDEIAQEAGFAAPSRRSRRGRRRRRRPPAPALPTPPPPGRGRAPAPSGRRGRR